MAPKQGVAFLIQLANFPGARAAFKTSLQDHLGIDTSTVSVLLTLVAASLLVFCWMRHRAAKRQQRIQQLLNKLSEEVIGSSTPSETLAHLQTILPQISEGLRVSLYLFNRVTRMLEPITAGSGAPSAIRPDVGQTGLSGAIALCFRKQTLIAVQDGRKNSFFTPEEMRLAPRSFALVPMFAQSELTGVMAVSHITQAGYFDSVEQASMQHLANQVATALRLQEQKTIRERLFRTEKLAASGRLIAGVAAELRTPLTLILRAVASLRARRDHAVRREMNFIDKEARRAADMVARLIAFGDTEQSEARPLDLHALLAATLPTSLAEQPATQIKVVHRFVNERVMVLGSRAQLEQVFLQILAHAQQEASEGSHRDIIVATTLLANRVTVEIGCSRDMLDVKSPQGEQIDNDVFHNGAWENGALGVGLCRGVLQSHGGDMRFVRVSAGQSRVEVELPTMDATPVKAEDPAAKGAARKRQLTALLVEPELRSQKRVLDALARRGHRVVPVSSAEEGADLAQRLRFDLILCTVQLPGLSWMELFDRIHGYSGAFILLVDSNEADLTKAFPEGEGFVLNKPVDEEQLNRVCDLAAAQTTVLYQRG